MLLSQDILNESLFEPSQHQMIDDEEDDERHSDDDVLCSSPGKSPNKQPSKQILPQKALTEDVKKRINDGYSHVYDELQRVKSDGDIFSAVEVLHKQLLVADRLYLKGGSKEHAPIDAKCILASSNVTKQLVKSLETDSKRYDGMEFAERLLTVLNPLHRVHDDDDVDGRISRHHWVEFGRKYSRFHRIVPTFEFIHGSFDPDMTPTQRNIQPRVKTQKSQSEVVHAKQIDPKTKAHDDSTPMEVEQILKAVKKLHVKNDRTPLPYFNVFVNPNSFSSTVENLFHSAFLVKDGEVALKLDDEEPVVEPVTHEDEAQPNLSEGSASQSILSFTMDDWNKWIQKYGIKKPAINTKKQ